MSELAVDTKPSEAVANSENEVSDSERSERSGAERAAESANVSLAIFAVRVSVSR